MRYKKESKITKGKGGKGYEKLRDEYLDKHLEKIVW
jgi:hypothetical protein